MNGTIRIPLSGAIRIPAGFWTHVILSVLAYGCVLGVRAVLVSGAESDTSVFNLLIAVAGGAVLVIMPFVSPPLAAVLLLLAGRTQLPPLWTGEMDVTALLLVGFVVLGINSAIASHHDSGRVRIAADPMILLGFAFSLMYLAQFSLSDPTDYAVEKVVRIAGFLLAILIVFAQVMTSQTRRETFSRYYLMIIGALSFASLAVAIAQQGILGIQRISPIGGGPITLGRFTGFAALVCIAMFIAHGRRYHLFLFGWFAVFTFLNGSRGPLLALLVTIAIVIAGSLIKNAQWRRWLTLNLFLCVSAVGLVMAFLAAVALQMPFVSRYLLIFQGDRGGASVGARVDFLTETRNIASIAPFWGNGVASWEYVSEVGAIHRYPHNILAELMVENGMIGLAIFGLLTLSALGIGSYLLLTSRSTRDYADALIGCSLLVFSLIGAQISGDMFDNRYIWAAIGWLSAVWISRVLQQSGLRARGESEVPLRSH